jgi:hypothetical protein
VSSESAATASLLAELAASRARVRSLEALLAEKTETEKEREREERPGRERSGAAPCTVRSENSMGERDVAGRVGRDAGAACDSIVARARFPRQIPWRLGY